SSALWFVCPPAKFEEVKALWAKDGENLEGEGHFASLKTLSSANFQVTVIDQHPGDLVVIPAMAVHQVLNKGKVTMKIAWNLITEDCL
ncbi:hypothetical protein BGZ74_003605, partial [Mortierella antarctica]